jgi:hypothetical protein
MRKKRIIAAGLVVIAVAVFLVCIPLIKLTHMSSHYELYGSYVVFPGETEAADTTSVRLATQSEQYRNGDLKITNVLYYPGLLQLSFGVIFDQGKDRQYDVKVIDNEGRIVAGDLRVVSGGERIYAKVLQKLNFQLEQPLAEQAVYTIVIQDDKGERAGSLDFARE